MDKLYILSNSTTDGVTFESKQSSGMLIGFVAGMENCHEFTAVPVSRDVLKLVSESFLKTKWSSLLLGNAYERTFQQYVAYSMMRTSTSFKTRAYVEKS
jgi:hypothetical protein